ncbi:SecDF P1 head subdomain-containing protein [Kribbella sp. NPDC051586]|uniref:SecDF P1 head subdomain-containing protein n=1 Tax=Kribbella sp. NPDC051586 TaxID=3364118 RepID=UPI0037A11525
MTQSPDQPGQPGQPQYPPLFPQQQQPPKRSRGPLLLVGGLVLLLVAIVATGVVLVMKRSDDKPAVAPAARTKPSDPTAVEFRRVLSAKPGTCPSPTPAGVSCDDKGTAYTLGKVELDGSNVSEVKAAIQQDGAGGWYVGLTLDSKGAQLFEQLTATLAKQTPPANQLAIVVRGQVVTAPTVQSAIAGGKIEISGGYTRDSAEGLATKITG